MVFWRLVPIAVAVFVVSRPAHATQPQADAAAPAHDGHQTEESPFRAKLRLDLPVTVAAMAVLGMPYVLADELLEPRCAPPSCQPSRSVVNTLDRSVIGNRNASAGRVSDALLITNVALPFALNALNVALGNPTDGWGGYATDSLVLLETAAITLATTNLLKFVIRRSRPYVYDASRSDESRSSGVAAQSFPSGHTSASFALATAYSRLFMLRNPKSPWIVPMWLGTYALAATTGALRTTAGDHFWTDVIAGAGLGVFIGYIVPELHLRDSPRTSLQIGLNPSHQGVSVSVGGSWR